MGAMLQNQNKPAIISSYNKSRYTHATNKFLKIIHLNPHNIKNWAILDSGATSSFLMTNAHTSKVIPTKDPITVTLPGNTKILSTHNCELDLPQLPKAARI